MSACLDCGGSECICRVNERVRLLTTACQIFTRGLGGENGYYPTLGLPLTKKAIEAMKSAGVKPIFYGEEPT